MMEKVSLAAIVTLARAGALALAWRCFANSGYDYLDSAEAKAVKGRLLKDRAMQAIGENKKRLWLEAADAYTEAGAFEASTYSLINAATLSLLGQDEIRSRSLALEVFRLNETRADEIETPYYRAATLAEALLLLGRDEEARATLAEAMDLAPRAWEDHASTLRQFGLILEAQNCNAAWLDAHRPPRSLHFGGHMSFDARAERRTHVEDCIVEVLEEEKVGFGYGALAAGADILVAEALLRCGSVLHAVLPGGPEAFAAVSVDPFGKAWRRRFDAVLERAETVRVVRPFGAAPDRATIALTDEIAMGAAVINARRLESSALQLLVLADEHQAEEARGRWGTKGWRQRIVTAPRETGAGSEAEPAPLPAGRRRALALLALSPGEEKIEARLGKLKRALRKAGTPAIAPYFTGRQVVLAYAEPAEAARAAVSLAQTGEVAIGGHYGLAEPFEDPFSGGCRVAGDAAALVEGAAASAPPGSLCVTEDFAAALAASGEKSLYSELIGELEARDGSGPVELYGVKPRLN